ncbi:MAG: DUF58 domain-containing protein [Burkholderiales bacterium]|nr:DUF58 domain-containing protein [Burkholderiales bacterium]
MSRGITPQIDEMLNMRYHANSIKMFDNRYKSGAHQIGNRLSHSKGRGVDFEEVRPYQNGDDIRLIHWSLTARLGKPYTKVYKEERERAVYLFIDQSSNMNFGTKVCFKNVLAANIASLLGFAALENQEQIGGIIFNDNKAQLFKPERTRQSISNMINVLQNQDKMLSHYNSFKIALKQLVQKIHYGSTIVIISDFSKFDNETKAYLNQINHKTQIINIMTYDPLEAVLPEFAGSFTFTATGKEKLKIAGTTQNRERYQNSFETRRQDIKDYSRKLGMQFISIATNDNIIDKINHGVMGYGCK